MNISAPFVKRPIGTSLLAFGMAVCGVICYFLLGVAALPNLEFPAIFVTANQPGASADTMASTVAAPLERRRASIREQDRQLLEEPSAQRQRRGGSSGV